MCHLIPIMVKSENVGCAMHATCSRCRTSSRRKSRGERSSRGPTSWSNCSVMMSRDQDHHAMMMR